MKKRKQLKRINEWKKMFLDAGYTDLGRRAVAIVDSQGWLNLYLFDPHKDSTESIFLPTEETNILIEYMAQIKEKKSK